MHIEMYRTRYTSWSRLGIRVGMYKHRSRSKCRYRCRDKADEDTDTDIDTGEAMELWEGVWGRSRSSNPELWACAATATDWIWKPSPKQTEQIDCSSCVGAETLTDDGRTG